MFAGQDRYPSATTLWQWLETCFNHIASQFKIKFATQLLLRGYIIRTLPKSLSGSLSGLISVSALTIGLTAIAQPALAQIADSMHNFTGIGANPSGYPVASTTEICVFCHTPHGANTNIAAPMWNKALQTSTYILYTSASLDSSLSLDPGGAGSISLACLSCHDGTQAMDSMFNKPGSGGYDPNGPPLGTLGVMPPRIGGTWVANFGVDMTGIHPIGMVWCGALNATDVVNGICPDDSFNVNNIAGSGTSRLWLETGTPDGIFQKSDLPLYGGNSAVGAGANVECATCHDPHSLTNPTFLRVTYDGSALCLTCHNK